MSELVSITDLEAHASKAIVGLKFQANKKPNFQLVLNLASKAHSFHQVDKLYLATFTRELNQMRLLATIIDEVRDWRGTTAYANGRPQRNRMALFNMLQSFLTASSCRKTQDHCHEVIDDPFVTEPAAREIVNYSIDLTDQKFWAVDKTKGKWLLPCKHLKGFLDFYVDDKPRAVEKLEAVAIERNCNLCPYFRAQDFRAV